MNQIATKTTFQKYPAYKDSGVEWLGKIPLGWTLGKLGTLLKPISIKGHPDLPLLSITRELGVIERNLDEDEGNHNFIPDDLSGYKVIQEGHFGMNKMKAWQGSYGISQFTGIVSPAYYVFDFTSEIDPRFFHFAIRSKNYVAFFGRASDGVRIGQWDLSKSRMKEIPFFIPSPTEQTAIANFLDDKTAKIDRVIAQKEKMIALLKERKQIIIQNAVTKGLDPKVKLKDSGVEWIGEIPEHWEVKRLKYVSDFIQTGTTPSTANQDFFDGGINWFNPKDLNNEMLYGSEKTVSEKALKRNEIKMFVADSVLIVGIGATTGKTAYMLNKGTFNQQITGFHSKKEHNKYLFYLLKSMARVMLNVASYTTLPILNNEFFKSFWIVTPSINEQQKIVSHIETQSTKIDQAIELQEQQIEKLKELKSTLIDSAVTGKIKVS